MRILDLYCGEGGAAMGLHQYFPDAEITGVDIEPQPHYPFGFVQADAMEHPLKGYDFVWASPPCQGYSTMRHLKWNQSKDYPLLIAPTREKLLAWGGPYIIENVMGARETKQMPSAPWLCGMMFGRRFYRHRLFEAPFGWLAPLHPRHLAAHTDVLEFASVRTQAELAVLGADKRGIETWPGRGRRTRNAGLAAWQQGAADSGILRTVGQSHASKSLIARVKEEMECEWMTAAGVSQAMPPCYSRYLAGFIPLI